MRQLKLRDRKNLLLVNEAESQQRDFPLVRSRIVENSHSKDYEEARREWTLVDVHDEKSAEFTDRCELCNQPGLRINFEIVNHDTGKRFLVGSRCITRFLILEGAITQEESNALFEYKRRQMMATKELQKYLPAILTEPTGWEVHAFREASRVILGTLDHGQVVKNPSPWMGYIKGLLGKDPPKWQIDLIRTVLFEPRKVKVKKVALTKTSEAVGHWAGKIKAKKTRAQLSINRSKEDQPGKAPE